MLARLGNRLHGIRASTLSRWLWASMLVLHVPALLASWKTCILAGADSERLGGCLLLSVTVVFFALKLWGVSFLQFRTTRRSLVAISVAVALMHADAIGARLEFEAVPAEIPVAAGVLFAGGLSRVQTAISGVLGGGCKRLRPPKHVASTGDAACRGAFAPRRWILSHHIFTPRAPPA